MATANLGRVGFVNKGTYSGATAYKVNDVVVYNSGTYACIQANTGQAPTNTSYWQNWVADNAVHKTGDETIAGVKTFSNNLNFASGTIITGDFSNADRAKRVSVQSSTINSSTVLQTIPNGSGAASYNVCFGSSDVNNSTSLTIGASSLDTVINANKFGTASYPPMIFITGGAERMRIDTAGNVGIGTNNPASTLGKTLHIYNSTNDGTPNSNASLKLESTSRNSAILLHGAINTINMFNSAGVSAGGIAMDSNTGTTLIFGSNGFGYGTGSGGTVTQLTSKSTAVTLNKPCGKITMNNASLAANTGVGFYLNNSLIGTDDLIVVNIGWDGSGDPAKYSVDASCYFTGGIALIYVKNITAGTLADSISINFALIKGAKA